MFLKNIKKVKNLLELYKMTLERYKYAGQICLRSGIYRLGQKETLKSKEKRMRDKLIYWRKKYDKTTFKFR